MAEYILADELPKWIPGDLLMDSDGLGWAGVSLRRYRYQGLDVEVPGLRDFLLWRGLGFARMLRPAIFRF